MSQVLSQKIEVLYPEKNIIGIFSPPFLVNDYEAKIRRWE